MMNKRVGRIHSCIMSYIWLLVPFIGTVVSISALGHGDILDSTDPRGDVHSLRICDIKVYHHYELVFEDLNDEDQKQNSVKWESVIRIEEECITVVHVHETREKFRSRVLDYLTKKTIEIDKKLRVLIAKNPIPDIDGINVNPTLTRDIVDSGILIVGNCVDHASTEVDRDRDSIIETDEDGNPIVYTTLGCVKWSDEYKTTGEFIVEHILVDIGAIVEYCRGPSPPYHDLDSEKCIVGAISDTLVHERLHFLWPSTKYENGKLVDIPDEHKKVRQRTKSILEHLSEEEEPPPIWEVVQVDINAGVPKPRIYVYSVFRN